MLKRSDQRRGFTLIEMLVTLTILAILAASVLPLAKTAKKREKEIELRRNLRDIRTAIDSYKKLADENRFEFEEETYGYPPDLKILVEGVELKNEESGSERSQSRRTAQNGVKIMKFLRRIPKDPMTNSYDWGLRSYQDKPDSSSWGRENVYDIYTKSSGTALDGTKYNEW